MIKTRSRCQGDYDFKSLATAQPARLSIFIINAVCRESLTGSIYEERKAYLLSLVDLTIHCVIRIQNASPALYLLRIQTSFSARHSPFPAMLPYLAISMDSSGVFLGGQADWLDTLSSCWPRPRMHCKIARVGSPGYSTAPSPLLPTG